MSKSNRRDLLTLFGVVSSDDGASAGASARQKKWAVVSPREKMRERHFPNVELLTHEGKRVKFYDDLIKDKIVVINFMYASCEGVCPAVMMNLAKVQKLLGERVGRDIFFYSLTLQPEKDSPQILRDYAKMHGVKAGWTLLTGKPADLELLRRKLGFTDPDPERDKDRANHIGNIRYGNEPLTRWGATPGMSDPGWLAESILWIDTPQESSPKGGSPQKAESGRKGGQK